VPIEKMFYQRWEFSEEELEEIGKEYNIMSLEVKGRLICDKCVKLIKRGRKNDK